jgi:hypothetical protein
MTRQQQTVDRRLCDVRRVVDIVFDSGFIIGFSLGARSDLNNTKAPTQLQAG